MSREPTNVLTKRLTPRSPRVLYIVYWGATEITGGSWILPHVRKLASLGATLTLVTFEKPSDWMRYKEVETSLRDSGVKWIPLRYHKRPKVPATAFDVLHGVARGCMRSLHTRFDILHARTFIGGLIGLALAPLVHAKLIYHNEGFYPDEQVDGGIWAAGSPPHRIAKFLEHQLYARSDAVITMSQRGKVAVESLPAVRRKRTPIIFAPACVDVEAFSLRATQPATRKGENILRFIYIGSVGGRYMLDAVGRFVANALREVERVHLRVLVKADLELVTSVLRSSGLPDGSWSVDSVPHTEVPGELARQDAGLFFLSQGLSEHGCSPTKIGEYWASGLPVVTTPNAGDTDMIVRRQRVGVIVNEHSAAAYTQAARELQVLLADPELAARCRQAAESHYALAPAIERQFKLYQDVMS